MVFSNHSIIKTFSKYLIASIVKEKLNAILKGLNLPMMEVMNQAGIVIVV